MSNDDEKFRKAVELQNLRLGVEACRKAHAKEDLLWRQIRAGIVDQDRLEEIERLMDEDVATIEAERRHAKA